MDKISRISGLAVPLNRRDVDTDIIIPAQYLTQVGKSGYAEALFRRLRDSDPDFVFNQARYQKASILIAGDNFGCGSSREHAVWALLESGINVVISSSFSDIFYSNAAKNNLILIQQPEENLQTMLDNAAANEYIVTIDIANQQIITSLDEIFSFALEPFRKHCLLNGLDLMEYILSHEDKITAYEQRQQQSFSTVFNALSI